VQRRALRKYLPIFESGQPNADTAGVRSADWSFLHPVACRWFLEALDEGVVATVNDRLFAFKISRNHPTRPVRGQGIIRPFGDVRPTMIYREVFFTVAAAGMLAIKFKWPVERLRFEPPPSGPRGLWWAFDLVAYDRHGRVALACETKKTRTEADALLRDLKLWCSGSHPNRHRPPDPKDNHHRKFLGLLDHRPRTLWIIEPGAFFDSSDRLFRVRVRDDEIVQLTPVRDPRAF
jgi:hypothetical protein